MASKGAINSAVTPSSIANCTIRASAIRLATLGYALPGALLAGLIGQLGERGRREGAYFGWWNFAAKLNLALAAGLALPVLAWLGYEPGSRDPQALMTLTAAYCLLPCVLKLIAGGALHWLVIRRPAHSAIQPV